MTPLEYEIRVSGMLPDHVVEALGDMRVLVQPVGTVLTGAVVDQAALHGVINRLQGAGLELIEVRRTVPRDQQQGVPGP
jgi:hypothetical protein